MWVPVILMRQFGLTPGQVGAGFGAAVAMGSVIGLATAAVVTKLLKSRWGALTPVRLPQIGYLIFGLLAPLYLVARSPKEIFLIATIQLASSTMANAMTPTVVQNLAPAHLRGRVFAISIVIGAFFQVISPISVGLMSDHVYTQSGGLLLAAVTVGAPCMILAAATIRLAEKQILRTVEAMQALRAPEGAG